LWDVAAGRPLYDAPVGEVQSLAFSANGRAVVTADSDAVRRWGAATGKMSWAVEASYAAVLSSDGRVAADQVGGGIRLVDATAGVDLPALSSLGEDVRPLALSPGGRVVAVTRAADGRRELALLDTASSKQWHALATYPEGPAAVAFSADGRTFAAVEVVVEPRDPQAVGGLSNTLALPQAKKAVFRTWDAASGRLLREFAAGPIWPTRLLVSPDGRYLFAYAVGEPIRVWETAIGKQVLEWSPADKPTQALAVSADGRTLATADSNHSADDPAVIRLWDAGTREELGRFLPAEQCHVGPLAFSPDGTRLASAAGWDGTALVWDVADMTGRPRPAAVRRTEEELTDLWNDLGSGDAAKAFEAGRKLARSEGAAAFAAARLPGWRRLLDRADGRRLARLIADLDADAFAVRREAAEDLRRLGPLAEGALRERLKDEKLSVEARSAIGEVLTGGGEGGEFARWRRATEALERAGTAEARDVLKQLAEGSDPVAEEAKASLERLGRGAVP
jgi:dipeptidyl aminopeptidase/acylaminoacyl peptidase